MRAILAVVTVSVLCCACQLPQPTTPQPSNSNITINIGSGNGSAQQCAPGSVSILSVNTDGVETSDLRVGEALGLTAVTRNEASGCSFIWSKAGAAVEIGASTSATNTLKGKSAGQASVCVSAGGGASDCKPFRVSL